MTPLTAFETAALRDLLTELQLIAKYRYRLMNDSNSCDRCGARYWDHGVPEPTPDNPNNHRFGNHKPDCQGLELLQRVEDAIDRLGARNHRETPL